MGGLEGPPKPPRSSDSPRGLGVSTASADDGNALPFTGLDAWLFAAVGGPLLLLGAGLRRYARSTPELG